MVVIPYFHKCCGIGYIGHGLKLVIQTKPYEEENTSPTMSQNDRIYPNKSWQQIFSDVHSEQKKFREENIGNITSGAEGIVYYKPINTNKKDKNDKNRIK